MTQEEIIEGNKTIAIFMGGKLDRFNVTHKEHFRNLPHGRTILFENLRYHSSWDWLMPVVEKINHIDNYAYDVVIWRSDCHINDKEQILIESSSFSNKESIRVIVWQAVIQFLQWYNLQTLNK